MLVEVGASPEGVTQRLGPFDGNEAIVCETFPGRDRYVQNYESEPMATNPNVCRLMLPHIRGHKRQGGHLWRQQCRPEVGGARSSQAPNTITARRTSTRSISNQSPQPSVSRGSPASSICSSASSAALPKDLWIPRCTLLATRRPRLGTLLRTPDLSAWASSPTCWMGHSLSSWP